MLGKFNSYKAVDSNGKIDYFDFTIDWVNFNCPNYNKLSLVVDLTSTETLFVGLTIDEAKKLRTILTKTINRAVKYTKEIDAKNTQSTSLTATI